MYFVANKIKLGYNKFDGYNFKTIGCSSNIFNAGMLTLKINNQCSSSSDGVILAS